jgi:adenosylcobyric acid synthase
MDIITGHTDWPALGLIPYFREAGWLPAEDAVALDKRGTDSDGAITIAVPRLAHIANFDDLDPLKLEPSVRLVMVQPGEPLPGDADLVILPGSKATLADLADFRRNGWDIDLQAHARRGGKILGLCGGYQMLGSIVADPEGIEGPPGSAEGLGLLDIETVLSGDKTLTEVTGTSNGDGVSFRGYEMHVGRTAGADCERPLLRFADGRMDGAVSADGRIHGTYVHGLFVDDLQRSAWIGWLGGSTGNIGYEAEIDRVLDALAAHLSRHIDIERLITIAR